METPPTAYIKAQSLIGAISLAEKEDRVYLTTKKQESLCDEEIKYGSGSTSASAHQYSCFFGSRMETRKEPLDFGRTAKKEKNVSSFYEAVVIPMKRENHGNPEEDGEERSEVLTELALDYQRNRKKPRTNSDNDSEVSTKLKLYDDTWPTANIPAAKDSFDEDRKKREMVYSKIAMMKHYSPRDEQEERINCVSTKLKLYLDPWHIKKRLKQSDLGHLCRLLVQTRSVDKYVLPFLSTDSINEVESKEGLRVMVWDQDTHSEHKLILKKWSTSKSYVFIDGWSQKFVSRRNLKAGDEVGLSWDPYCSRFNFRLLNRFCT